MKIVSAIKTGLSIIGGLTIAGAVMLLIFYLRLPPFFSPEREVDRLSSPDNKYDAVVTIQEPGGFGSSHVRLYIVNHGTPFKANDNDFKFASFHSHAIVLERLKWLSPETLRLVRGSDDSIYSFDPKWKEKVRIVLETKNY